MHYVAVQTPRWQRAHQERMLKFGIRLLLPAERPGTPLMVNSLSTILPQFSHHVHDMGETAYFESIDFETDNMFVHVDVSGWHSYHPLMRSDLHASL